MRLRELNIGDSFFIGCGKTIWIKKTVQGMNDDYSYCESMDYKQTRRPHRLTKWERLFSQDLEVSLFERDDNIQYENSESKQRNKRKRRYAWHS